MTESSHRRAPTRAPISPDPADLGVLDAATLLRSGALSAGELLAACQARIASRNGGAPTFEGAHDAVNAWARLYPGRAIELARAADERRARDGADTPLLCGIPLGLKDLYAVAGLPLTASSRVLEDHVAEVDSVAWTRLRDAGMVLVGHTHTHEFAAGGTTGQVGNPWALDLAPGGSSGGSGAALAAGMVPAALGTDTLGSLRIPAALCGVSSIKPTHGRVPIDGILPLAASLDHAGPMARTVADCSALLAGLASGGGEITPLMPPPAAMGPLPLAARAGPRPLAGTRVAVTDRPDAVGMHPDVAAGFEIARTAVEDLGGEVVELAALGDLPVDDLMTILLSDMWTEHADYADRTDRYRPSIAGLVAMSRDATEAQAYIRAQARRARVTARWEAWFARHRIDALLEPTVPVVAGPRAGGYDASNLGGDGDPLIALTATWDVTGFPVAALPACVGHETGLPVGISLIAPRGAEAPLIQIAIDLQEHALPPIVPGM